MSSPVILCDDGDPFAHAGGTPLRRKLSPSTKRIVVLAQDRGALVSQDQE